MKIDACVHSPNPPAGIDWCSQRTYTGPVRGHLWDSQGASMGQLGIYWASLWGIYWVDGGHLLGQSGGASMGQSEASTGPVMEHILGQSGAYTGPVRGHLLALSGGL